MTEWYFALTYHADRWYYAGPITAPNADAARRKLRGKFAEDDVPSPALDTIRVHGPTTRLRVADLVRALVKLQPDGGPVPTAVLAADMQKSAYTAKVVVDAIYAAVELGLVDVLDAAQPAGDSGLLPAGLRKSTINLRR